MSLISVRQKVQRKNNIKRYKMLSHRIRTNNEKIFVDSTNINIIKYKKTNRRTVQSAETVENNNCISTYPKECPVYDTKQSDGKALLMLELLRMRNALSSQLLPSPLCL